MHVFTVVSVKADHCSSVVIFLVSNPVPSIKASHADILVSAGTETLGYQQGNVYLSLLLVAACALFDLDCCYQ